MKIRIVLNHPGKDAPADRRRMGVLLRELPKLGHDVALYEPGDEPDVLIVAQSQRYATWLPVARALRRKGKVVVHDVTNDVHSGARSMAAAGASARERISHRARSARWMVQRALRIGNWGKAAPFWRECTAIVTGSRLQADGYAPYCARRFALVDAVPPEEYSKVATHAERRPIVLAWEGTSDNLPYVLAYAPAWRALETRGLARLRIITAPRRSSPYEGTTDNRELLRRHGLGGAEFVEWRKDTFADAFATADVGIAPLPLNDPFSVAKPANKILGYAAMGLPVVCSPIPAYEDVLNERAFGLTAATVEDWVAAVERLAGDWKLRRDMGVHGRAYAADAASPEAFARSYLEILTEVGEAIR